MKTETIEEFLARGGKVEKSSKEATLEELLLNEGLMNHEEAKGISETLSNTLKSSLDKNFQKSE